MTKRELFSLITKEALAIEKLTKSIDVIGETIGAAVALNNVMAQHIVELQARVTMVEKYNRINTN